MQIGSCRKTRRRGTIAPLTGVLLVAILGTVAFAVDITWMALTKSELQNAADAAALAGANKLADNFVLYSLPGQTAANKASLASNAVSSAKTYAKNYAAYNTAGGVSSLTLLDSDINVGFTDSTGNFTSYSSNSANYPNTVKVVLRRDSTANTSLKLFFAPVIGVNSMDLTASAGATLYGGVINSFKVGSSNTGMLPLTYDRSHWDNFIKTGQDPDGNTTTDSNGSPVLQVYPSVKAPGNFGLISLNDSHVGASTLSNWIHNGVSPSDIQALLNSNLIPLSAHDPTQFDWNGETGFKASNVMDINEYVGKTYVIPLFTPYNSDLSNYSAGTGQGSNYNYSIVQFVGVKIMPAPSNNRDVIVQPALITDPNVILDSSTISPLGTSSTFITGLAPAKLTN